MAHEIIDSDEGIGNVIENLTFRWVFLYESQCLKNEY